MSYLNRFTKETNGIIKNARQIAADNKQPFIAPIHFLMGILTVRESLASLVLEEMGFDLMLFYDELKQSLEPEDGPQDEVLIFTPHIKTIFEQAEKEMEATNWDCIDSLHILLAMFKCEDEVVLEVFHQYECTYEDTLDTYFELKTEDAESLGKGIRQTAEHIAEKMTKVHGKQGAPAVEESALETYGRNLTRLAREKKLDPVIGRENEIERCWRVLCRRKKNNVVCVGEAGVGKTAIAEGIANKIASGKVPFKMMDKEIYLLDVNGMVAGSKFRGDFEKKMQDVIAECEAYENIILFIDEIHTLIGSGSTEGGMDGANILKPALASGAVQVIGATTVTEYQKYFEKDSALVRRFQKLVVNPPDRKTTVKILKGLAETYEQFHQVVYSDDTIELIAELSEKYLTTQFEPDRSINTLDEVGSKISLQENSEEKELLALKKKVINAKKKLEDAVLVQEYKKADELKQQYEELSDKYEEMINSKDIEFTVVTEKDVREVFSLLSGVPVEDVKDQKEDTKRYINMAAELKKKVINQDEAIDAISSVIKRKKAGVDDENKPSVLFFAGATGTGKTHTAKELASFLFGDRQNLVFLNGAEYSDRTALNRLTGGNPGYVGYGEATDFEEIRNNPYSILLIDECEKMHASIWKTFLRIFDEGELKTANGKVINFKNCVIILTSNIGSETSQGTVGLNLGEDQAVQSDGRKMKYHAAVKKFFKPEVYNRLSKVVVFNDLSRADLNRIVTLELKPLTSKLKAKGIKLTVNKKAKDYILDANEDKKGQFGARPIKRSIERNLADKLSDLILGNDGELTNISVSVEGSELAISAL